MAAKTKKKGAVTEEQPPVRDPQKGGTQAPESGPTGDAVVDATTPAPELEADAATPAEKSAARAQEKAQKQAENEAKDRSVRVRATRDGFINRYIVAGTVFILNLKSGESLPSWVEAVTDEVPTSSITHSSEAKPEVVGADGVGRKIDSNDVL
jgi:hypothetical protein